MTKATRAATSPALRRHLLHIVWAFCLGASSVFGQGVSQPKPETMVVSVTLNSQNKGDLFVLQSADGDFLLRLEDLKEIGLQSLDMSTATVVEGIGYLSLRALQGISFKFRPQELVLELIAEPRLLPRTTINAGEQRPRSALLQQRSGFLNYAIEHAGAVGGGVSKTTLSGEAGLRVGDFLLLSEGTSQTGGVGAQRFVRLRSSATRDDLLSLQRLVIGDFFSRPAELGTTVNLGGVIFSKQYGLDPSLSLYPLGTLQGQVSLPSEIDVVINGQRVRTERVRPGEFEIRDLAGYAGAQSVQLIIRDAFGRSQQLNYGLYFTDEPLRQGLHEYSYAAGALRKNFGTASNDYGAAAFSAFHKYGVSNAATIGLRAEGRRGLLNVSSMGTLVLGTAGVLNGIVSASRAAGHHGRAGLLRYSYRAGSLAIGASARRDSPGYTALNEPRTYTNRKWEASFFASRYWPGFGSLSASHSLLTVHPNSSVPTIQNYTASVSTARRVSTLGYYGSIPSSRASFSLNVSHIKDEVGSRNEVTLGLGINLDSSTTLTATSRRTGPIQSDTLALMQSPPLGEGWGYDLTAERQSDEQGEGLQLRASTQLNTRVAVFGGEIRHARGTETSTSYRLTVAGGLAWVGGKVYSGPPVNDSFAVAQVGDIPGIAVSVNGQAAGTTDKQGRLFVPSMSSYYENEVSIDSRAVPIEYAVAHVSRRVTLPLRSGAIVDFGVERVQAVTGMLLRRSGSDQIPMALAEVVLETPTRKIRATTGPDGEIYIENVPSGTHSAQGSGPHGNCNFVIDVPSSTEIFIDVGKVICE